MKRMIAVTLILLLPAMALAQPLAGLVPGLDAAHPADGGTTGRLVQITALFTVLSLAPAC